VQPRTVGAWTHERKAHDTGMPHGQLPSGIMCHMVTISQGKDLARTRPRAGDGGRTVDPTVEAIERLLVGGIGVTALALSEARETIDLTLLQWRVLMTLASTDHVRIGELASRLGISIPSASRLIRRLEDRGLVSAERADDDRRATNVRLSERGRRLRARVLARRRGFIAEATEGARAGIVAETVKAMSRIADSLSRFA
jgi:DNA-binding MarR family transcriptional regulator